MLVGAQHHRAALVMVEPLTADLAGEVFVDILHDDGVDREVGGVVCVGSHGAVSRSTGSHAFLQKL